MREKILRIIEVIADERLRQIEEEGYLPAQDDAYVRGELPLAAAAYAMPPEIALTYDVTLYPWANGDGDGRPPAVERRTALIRAAALIVAEIERLDRLAGTGG